MIDFDLNQGLLKSRNMNFDMDAITLNGNYYNKNLKSEENSEIILENIKLKLNGELFEAKATIKGLNNPTLNIDFKTQFELSKIRKLGYECIELSIDIFSSIPNL